MPKVSETILLDDTMLGPTQTPNGWEYMLFVVYRQAWESPKRKRHYRYVRSVIPLLAPDKDSLEKSLIEFLYRKDVEHRDGVDWS